MAEPTLNEILNAGASADSEKASGTPATVIDNSGLVKQLNENARFKAENDWRKYNTFLSNLKESYKDLGDISGMEIATQDRDALKQQTADIFKDIADNPRAFFGGQKLGEIQSKIAGLRSAATESKLNRVYDFAHREYMNRNPELNTQENQKTINEYWKQPLGKRNPYMLNMPPIFDVQEYAKGIMTAPQVMKTQLGDLEFSTDKQFYRQVDKTVYDKDAYKKMFMSGLNVAKDKYGHSVRGAIEQQFNQLPDQLKKQFGSVEGYFEYMADQTYGSDKNIEKETKGEFKPNPELYKEEELKLKKEGVRQKWAMYGLAERKLNDAEEEDMFAADAVFDDAMSKISGGTPITEDQGGGNVKNYFEIADPDLIKKYSTIDKDGKTTNTADVIRYDPEKQQASMVYFKKKPYNAKLGTGGEIITTKSGKREVDKTIPIDVRTWLSDIAESKFKNKDLSKVNKLIAQVLQKNPGGLKDLMEKKEGKQPQSSQQKSYKLGTKTFTSDQVQKAAQQSGMTVDEYIKEAKLK